MSRRTRFFAVFAVGVVAAVAASAVGADWPEWRGPGRNGLAERSPALVSSLAGLSPLWRSDPIPGGDHGGRGSLVVHAGRVYGLTGAPDGPGAVEEVFCLDAGGGKTLWKAPLREGGPSEAGSSTPFVRDGRLYVVGSDGTVHCLSADDGRPVWRRELARKSGRPVASSVAVAGRVVVLLADVLTGLDAQTGEPLWTQERVTGHESSPAVWGARGRDVVIGNSARETYGVDPADGRVLWTVPGGGKST